jgi:hypothetical protein
MGVEYLPGFFGHAQGRPYIPKATALNVCLQEQALHLPSSGLLLTFDLVEGELQGLRRRQPSLQ